MKLTQEINRLLIALLVAFLIMMIAAAYWSISGAEDLLLREDNPRRVEAEAAIKRGQLVDRAGLVLAESIPQADGSLQRVYYYPEAAPFTGYFSLRYGTGGAETAYNTLLRGDAEMTLDLYVERQMLHRPPEGADIQLTLSVPLQQKLNEALLPYRGAGVLLAAPTGDILALVSQPTFDPNTLDIEWDSLREAEGNPFFNRVLQGRYQPGGVLETPLLAAALLSNRPLNEAIPDANEPLVLDAETTVSCAFAPGDRPLTLVDAYLYGCPAPFAALGEVLGETPVNMIFTSFAINQPATLEGFVPAELIATTPTAEPQPTATPEDTLVRNVLGQGQQSISPLNMAMIAAAVGNEGNAPAPRTLLAVRPRGADWQPAVAEGMTQPYLAASAAQRLSEFMTANMLSGVMVTPQPQYPLAGHAGIAYSGKGKTLSWFIGFVTLPDTTLVSIAIVLEDVNDPGTAAEIGQQVLMAAYDQHIVTDVETPPLSTEMPENEP